MKFGRVVVTGSIASDHIMSMPGKFKDHIMPDKIHAINVSFIMDSFRNEYGGTGANMAYTLALLEVPTYLFACAGSDFTQKGYRQHLEKLETLDLSGVTEVPDQPSAQGFVMTDRDDNQIWGFFEGAMKQETHQLLAPSLKQDDFVIIGPTNPTAMVQYVRDAQSLKLPYMFDPAFNIAHFSDEQLIDAVNSCKILIGNDYEMDLIRRRIRMTDEELYSVDRIVVTTFGAEGSTVRQADNQIKVDVPKVDQVLDPTGAGDAYRAGFVAGYLRGLDLETCAQVASITAAYAVENHGTQNQDYTVESFCQRFEENYGKVLKL